MLCNQMTSCKCDSQSRSVLVLGSPLTYAVSLVAAMALGIEGRRRQRAVSGEVCACARAAGLAKAPPLHARLRPWLAAGSSARR